MNSLAPLDASSAEERVLGWQTRLHRWAVEDEQARFGDLFNLICDPATLLVAWERVKRNRGSKTAGVDGETRKRIEQAGVEKVLGELRQALRDRTYTPLPVREHEIPKRGSGKVRKLGIPALRDRIVQMATKLVLEPIFEADFCPTSYGFRPGRRAQDAIEEVRFFINAALVRVGDRRRRRELFRVDPSRICLMEQVRRRVTDKRVLPLIRRFLGAGIMTQLGTLTDTPSGTPQGAILSPAPVEHRPLGTRPPLRGGMGVTLARLSASVTGPRACPAIEWSATRTTSWCWCAAPKPKPTRSSSRRPSSWQSRCGLTLSPEKTHITHVDDGFDLLGFRIVRRPGGVTSASPTPSQASERFATSCTASRR